jgi:NAD(P)-dependent dehydrogenase (short-subunit alcohol dehydrogenase family)
MDTQRFAGQVAVVTGGASGIGEGIVRRLHAEGGSVVAADINEERLKDLGSELGERVATIRADVTREADMEAMVAMAVEGFGAINAGFNVAGAAQAGPIVDLTEEAWDYTVDLCLKGVFLAMKHEARQLLAQGNGGAIVIISSLNSEVPMFGGSPYCAAKAGAAMMAKCGALEWGDANVRVNAISPGLVDTPLTAMLSQIPGMRDAYMERIPANRAATPADIAGAACFLASDDAAYISGVNLFVDGGWATTTYPDLRAAMAAMQQGG